MRLSLRTVILGVMSCVFSFALLAPDGERSVGASYALLLFMLMLAAYSATGASIACDKTFSLQSAVSGILVGFFLACGIVFLVVFNASATLGP